MIMKKFSKKKLIIYAAVISAAAVFCFWQNNMLTVSEYSYKTDKIGTRLDGFKIVQISDLHNKSFGKNQKRLVEKIERLSPDIIVITGDIADSNHTDIPKALEFIEESVKIAPTYYITGNHEYWLEDSELAEITDCIENSGAVYLSNETVNVTKNREFFTLTGVDDLSLVNFSDHCPKLDSSQLNVILAHEPQYITDYSVHGNVDLVLSGHAHGGQFRLPFLGGVIAPDQGFFPEYTEGVHTMGNTTMIISRGLGNSVIPLRLFNYPEIVCVTLEKNNTNFSLKAE